MKRKYLGGILVIISLFFTLSLASSVKNVEFMKKSNVVSLTDEALINSSNKFGLDIFKEEIKNAKNSNLTISPISLFTCFSVVANGANGTTKKQIKEVMNLSNYSDDSLNAGMNNFINYINQKKTNNIKSATRIYNSLWIDKYYDVKDSFIKSAKIYYDSDSFKKVLTDKSTVRDMNQWIADKSNGLIKNPIAVINKDTVLSIFNVLYFKDKWLTPFDKSNTKKEKFVLASGSSIITNIMNDERKMKYYEDKETKVGILDYLNGKMMVLLPKGNINEFASKLTNTLIDKYNKEAETFTTKIKMPILNISNKNNLNNSLKKMGMLLPFDENNANFDNIKTNKMPLWISEVMHDCVVKVDEEGTKAAALTSVTIDTKCAVSSPTIIKEFYVNKPFIFIIQDNTSNLVLFVGKVENPSLK